MRFTNQECLEKILLAVRNGLVPSLTQSTTTMVALGVVENGLEELLKRETVTPEYLKRCIPEGLALTREQIGFLESIGGAGTAHLRERQRQLEEPNPEWNNVAGLQKKCDDLMAHLEDCATCLLDSKAGAGPSQKRQISEFIRRNAEWDVSFHETQAEPLPAANYDHPVQARLDPAALEAFIARQLPGTNSIKVENIQRAFGGYGKETWLFDLIADGARQELVVRRANPMPGMLELGTWQITQEFPTVKILHDEGVMVPEPLWLGVAEPGMGRDFYVARRVAGKPMGTFMKGNDDLTEALWLQVAEQLARVHGIPIEKFSSHIEKFYGPELVNCTASQGMLHYLDRWRDYWKGFKRFKSPLEIYLFEWLYDHLPTDSRPATLVHTDCGPHNLLAEGQRFSAMLDWEAVLFGSPGMDLAYIRRWVVEVMDWQKFVDHYEACGGRHIDPEDYVFCDALTYVRTVTATNMQTANLRYNVSPEYKDLLMSFLFVPKMLRVAYDNVAAAPVE